MGFIDSDFSLHEFSVGVTKRVQAQNASAIGSKPGMKGLISIIQN